MLYKFKPIKIIVGGKSTGSIKKAANWAQNTKERELIFTWSSLDIDAEELLDYLKRNLLHFTGLYGCNCDWSIKGQSIKMRLR